MTFSGLKKGWSIRLSICWLAVLVCAWPYFLFSQTEFIQPDKTCLLINWRQNAETDMSYYLVAVGRQAGIYADYKQVAYPDTAIQICITDVADSVFVAVAAINKSGWQSAFSKEIKFVPEVVKLDFNKKSDRIDIGDWQAVYAAIRENWGRTVFK